MASMRYLLLHTVPVVSNADDVACLDAHHDAACRFHAALAQAGVLRDAVLLRPDAEGARIHFQAGRPATIERGPFADAHGLAAFCAIETASRQEALDWLERWSPRDTWGARLELRESGCPGGVMTVMADQDARDPARGRYAILLRSNAHLDAELAAPQPRLDAMTRRNEAGLASGVLLAGEGLKGSARGSRMHVARGLRSLTDGPFTEVKEMVAGYWVIQARDIAEAIEWVRTYPYPVDDAVVDVRVVEENRPPRQVAATARPHTALAED
jgi:hypothetical protein